MTCSSPSSRGLWRVCIYLERSLVLVQKWLSAHLVNAAVNSPYRLGHAEVIDDADRLVSSYRRSIWETRVGNNRVCPRHVVGEGQLLAIAYHYERFSIHCARNCSCG